MGLNPSHISAGASLCENAVKSRTCTFRFSYFVRSGVNEVPSVQIGPGKSSVHNTADEYIMVSEIEEAIRLLYRDAGRTGAVNDLQRRYFYRQTGNLCNYIKCNTGLFYFFCILEAFFLRPALKVEPFQGPFKTFPSRPFSTGWTSRFYQSRKFFKLFQYSALIP